MLRGAADARHDGPEKKLKIVLGQAHEYKANPYRRVANPQYVVPRQDAAERAGDELERAADRAGHAEHDAEFGVAEVQLAQNQGEHKGFKRGLSMVDSMRQTDESERGTGAG